MVDDLDKQVSDYLIEINEFNGRFGATWAIEIAENADCLMRWLAYLRRYHVTGTANELLDGTQAAIGETIGCVCIGLVRPGLLGLRAQIDMTLSWLYFKDHAVEWNTLSRSGKGFKLKSEIVEYLREHNSNFKEKRNVLTKSRTRVTEDPYGNLSAFVHGQSGHAIPQVKSLSDLIGNGEVCRQCTQFQWEVSEYLGDILMAIYGADANALPDEIVAGVRGRLDESGLRTIFSPA